MYNNAQFKNTGNDEGDILNFFNNQLRNLVQKNGGDNTFSVVTENCHDKDCDVHMGVKTKLRLTHSAHSISQIEKGFVHMEVQVVLYFEHKIPATTFFSSGSSHLNYIFVGFKDAVEIIEDAQFWI